MLVIFPYQPKTRKDEICWVFSNLRLCNAEGLLNICVSVFTDGPLPEPSMVRPTGPNQMVNRMQGPGKQ